jgi:hypothetical protein
VVIKKKLRKVSYQGKLNRTGSLSCLMAVTGISGVESRDNGNRKLSD